MLIRSFVGDDYEVRLEQRPFRLSHLEGLSPSYRNEKIKQNRFMVLLIENLTKKVKTRGWFAKDFKQAKAKFNAHCKEHSQLTDAEIGRRFWSIGKGRTKKIT